jgi:ferredoxin-NADP reductase
MRTSGLPTDATAVNANLMRVVVNRVSDLADGIRAYEFARQDGAALPGFCAGAHIDVHLPGGLVRQYSLCNAATDLNRYVVAVLRETAGRGGSAAMHDLIRPGSELVVSPPKNTFPLSADAERYLFIAGGIGITPILAMLTEAQSVGKAFQLYFCTRNRARTPFLDVLDPLINDGRAVLHHDEGDINNALDLGAVLREREPGAHLYYCGPSGLMDAIARHSAHWPKGTVHFERFAAAADAPAPLQADDAPFEVEITSTGDVFPVPANRTIVAVLRDHGIAVDVSCEEGYCGTCMTRYVGGEPLHRDSVLDEEDRREFVMICCARSRGKRLILDL